MRKTGISIRNFTDRVGCNVVAVLTFYYGRKKDSRASPKDSCSARTTPEVASFYGNNKHRRGSSRSKYCVVKYKKKNEELQER